LIANSKSTLKIASFYWILTADPEFAQHPSALPGRELMDAITAAVSRGVKLQVVLDGSSSSASSKADVDKLKEMGVVKFLNMTKLLKSGVMHTKFLIADDENFYLGSSNFDWRSYTQIKEIGISFRKCKVLAEDLEKIFQTYVLMSDTNEVPETLPESLGTKINIDHPLSLKLDNLDASVFLAGAPPAFNGLKNWTGRTDDIDGLLHIINKARRRIDISVMNYSPRTEFIWPKKFWPRIDDALRRAASERRVKVRLLFSDWSHKKPEELMWYKSLNAIQSPTLKGGGIHVRMFKVPIADDFERSIPFARVKHDKYLVSDNGLYIGTSNWSPDYFINTCGVSIVIQPNSKIEKGSIIQKMSDLFDRDFSSEHSEELE